MSDGAPVEGRKTVHVIPRDWAVKRLCFDDQTLKLRPNLVLVDRQGSVVFEINELGLKGGARDPTRKLAVVWGDSVVFGLRGGWPCLIDEFAPRYQFLNGGIEGDPYDNILRRAADFNRRHVVDLNILMLGWHPIIPPPWLYTWRESLGRRLLRRLGVRLPSRVVGTAPTGVDLGNQRASADLGEFLQRTQNTALVTMPTALNRDIMDRDLSSYFVKGDVDTVFRFAGDAPYSLGAQRFAYDHIVERNAIARGVAAATGTRLVDLAAEFDTTKSADFRADFHDVMHLKPRAYRKAAAAVYAGISDLLTELGRC